MEEKDRIVLKNIWKGFKNQEVLKDVNLIFESAKIYGIIGYNGSGKTVLLKCISGFLTPDEGTICFNEKQLKKDLDMLPAAGIIIEEPAFIKNCSGRKNLEYLYMIRNKPDAIHVGNIMRLVGLDPDSKKRVGNYSLGMKQRLAIAQAIMENPSVLILDEPMNGLDKKGIMEMRALFLQLKKQGKMILLASHSKEDIEILCDEVYEIENGRIREKRDESQMNG